MKWVLKRLSQIQIPRIPIVPRVVVLLAWLLGLCLIAFVLWFAMHGQTVDVLQTRGEIGNRQRDLLVFASLLAVVVLMPVYIMLFVFAWRYKEGHHRKYTPKWDGNKRYETIWWSVPILIVSVLAVITWVTSHSLDPYKPLASDKKPLQVQVIALDWKWLFIYPEYQIASVNELQIPVNRPVEFTITSDAPMNSFWIPQLGGQIYAMSGMQTKLHLIADEPGEYRGMSANISGEGFADMHFKTYAESQTDFNQWIDKVHGYENTRDLDMSSYSHLAEPGTSVVQYYHLQDQQLFYNVMMKYMGHSIGREQTSEMTNMEYSN